MTLWLAGFLTGVGGAAFVVAGAAAGIAVHDRYSAWRERRLADPRARTRGTGKWELHG